MAWTPLSQVLHTLASFGAMLALVRIILREERGWAGAVVGFPALLIVLTCGAFMAQARQGRSRGKTSGKAAEKNPK